MRSSGDPRITRMLLAAFENGYGMGFSHVQNSTADLEHTRAAIGRGCADLVSHEQDEAPLSAEALQSLLQECPKIAERFVAGVIARRAKAPTAEP